MRRALLDINVLIALLDEKHSAFERAHAWLAQREAWASCPLTQNGAVRIRSQRSYSNPVALSIAVGDLARTVAQSNHAFWPDDVSLLDSDTVDRHSLYGSKQITDTYLLALAVNHDGVFATFDTSISLAAVIGAKPHHLSAIA